MSTPSVIDLYRHHFLSFVRFAFRELNPATPLIDNWHIELIADRLMRCAPGGQRRLMINLPPRYLKSFLTSVCWPIFLCAHHPGLRICICVGTHDLALDLDAQRCRLLGSSRCKAVFPNMRPAGTMNVLRFANGSEIVQTVVARSQMGRGADIFIIDDPMSTADVAKPRRRDATSDWYTKELVPRLNRKATSTIVIVMQRLQVEDLCATAIAGGDGWDHLKLAAIARHDESWTLENGTVLSRRAHEALSPRQESRDALLEVMNQVRGLTFYAQYLQEPRLGSEIRGNGGLHPHVYDGWTPGMPMVCEPVLVGIRSDIRRDYFGERHPQWRPGWRPATHDEIDESIYVGQQKLIAQARSPNGTVKV